MVGSVGRSGIYTSSYRLRANKSPKGRKTYNSSPLRADTTGRETPNFRLVGNLANGYMFRPTSATGSASSHATRASPTRAPVERGFS